VAPLLFRHVLGGRRIGDARRVDGHRQGPQLGDGPSDGRFEIARPGHVGLDLQGAAAERLDPRDGLRGAGAAGPIQAGNVGAGFGEADGDALTDSAGGAGHEGDISGEVEEIHSGLLAE
jgi:hypothetical protein